MKDSMLRTSLVNAINEMNYAYVVAREPERTQLRHQMIMLRGQLDVVLAKQFLERDDAFVLALDAVNHLVSEAQEKGKEAEKTAEIIDKAANAIDKVAKVIENILKVV